MKFFIMQSSAASRHVFLFTLLAEGNSQLCNNRLIEHQNSEF